MGLIHSNRSAPAPARSWVPRGAPLQADGEGGSVLPEVMVRRLPPNIHGRDFLVGDIHGSFDAVIEGMRQVKFDTRVDRIISVGDLIDRGRGSSRVVGFLKQPYVHAVRGNHDHEFAKLDPAEIRLLARVPRLGMGWAQNLSDEALLEIQAALRTLPVAIELPTVRGMVGVVHAQVPDGMTWPAFVQALERRDPAVIDCALTERHKLQSGNATVVQGVGRVFVGHTTQQGGALMLGNVVAIDTGAVLREMGFEGVHHLTMVNAVARTGDIGPVVDQALAVMAIDSQGEGAFSALRPRG